MDRRGRLKGLLVAGALLCLVLAARLCWLQAWRGPSFFAKMEAGLFRERVLVAFRGQILDRRGRALVYNEPRLKISWRGAQLKDPAESLALVGEALQWGPQTLARRLKATLARPDEWQASYCPFAAGIAARLAELQDREPALVLTPEARRGYPQQDLACHLLGYLGEGAQSAEMVGKDGLESRFESVLRGRPGILREAVNYAGARQILRENPVHGRDLRLSIDLELQRLATQRLQQTLDQIYWKEGEKGAGAIIAIEPDTGKIRAMASLPGYAPGWFTESRYSGQVKQLLNDPDSPLINRAIAGLYPAASTFKLITSVAAFRANLLPEGRHFYCPGHMFVGDVPFHCFVRSGHGSLGFEDALAHSCDVAFYELGVQLGPERLKESANDFGLGHKTGVELPAEAAGLVPDPEYKLRETGGKSRWYGGDDANLSIGQGFLLVTPLQMSVVVSAFANGGRVVRPTLLEGGRQNDRSVEIPPTGMARIRAGMEGAVRYGTAAGSYSPACPLAGKTGTVENSPSQHNPRGRNHTWFVGYGPVAHPHLAVVVLLERSGGYGGALAAPIARDIVQKWESVR